MLTALLLASSFAHAGSDVGDSKKFGIGVATGAPLAAFTGKYWFNDKSGLAFYAGTAIVYHTARASFQSNIHTWGESWSWGQLPLYWHVDAEAGVYTVPGYTVAPTLGVGGGVGVALQFQKVPAEVFVEAGLGVGYNGYCVDALTGTGVAAACYLRGMGAGGGRWYF